MKRQLMGYGLTSDVFEWQNHTVLKLFKSHIEDQVIEYEALIHGIVYETEISMPRLIEEVEVDGRRGYIYQRINGTTLLFQITKKIWRTFFWGKLLARTQLEIHNKVALLLPDIKVRLREDINKVRSLPIETVSSLMLLIDTLPDGNRVCHMDFHPSNVFYYEKETTVIDWITASKGNPAADVARTYILMKYGTLPKDIDRVFVWLYYLARQILVKTYIKTYLKESGLTWDEVSIWLKPVAAARLSEDISEEEKQILIDRFLEEI